MFNRRKRANRSGRWGETGAREGEKWGIGRGERGFRVCPAPRSIFLPLSPGETLTGVFGLSFEPVVPWRSFPSRWWVSRLAFEKQEERGRGGTRKKQTRCCKDRERRRAAWAPYLDVAMTSRCCVVSGGVGLRCLVPPGLRPLRPEWGNRDFVEGNSYETHARVM